MDPLDQLACDLSAGLRAVFITGAGLSVASGISPYRGSKGAIWQNFVLEWGTRRRFLKNPDLWYNQFWLRTHEKPEYFNAEPNMGHFAISDITHHCNARVITQNIDKLHLKTALMPDKLVEVHGTLGLYKCVQKNCRYSYAESITDLDIRDYAINNSKFEDGSLQIKTPPCPSCSGPVLPQALLFDEDYTSHLFYQWEKVMDWLYCSDIFIFVGTSFSVGITQEALVLAQTYGKKTYNFNLYEEEVGKFPNMSHVLGPCEETLPKLARKLLRSRETRRPRLWYY